MARRRVEFNFDLEAEIAQRTLDGAELAERHAGWLAEQLRDLTQDQVMPSLPGEPPASHGPLDESIKSSKAKKRRDKRVGAYAYSLLTSSTGFPLLLALDIGTSENDPRPIIDRAVERTRQLIEADLDNEIARMRAGMRNG